MMPAFAKGRHVFVEERTKKLIEFAETSSLNRTEISDKAEFGVITNGAAYQYVKEALGEKASVLKLGIVNPLPVKLIQDFAAKYEKIYVIEELDGIIEQHCRNIGVTNIQGKEIFGCIGELSQSIIAEKLLGITKESASLDENIPVRPPGYHFPFRNRIIAALSKEVNIMELSERSGTMTTVNEALELGKEIKVLPFSVFSDSSIYNKDKSLKR